MSYNSSGQQNYPPINETNPRSDIRGEYTRAPHGTQIDANWNSASGVGGNQAAHHRFGNATGPHFGNFTGAQGYPQNTNNYPPNASGGAGEQGYNASPYSRGPQTSTYDHTARNPQHPTGDVIGAVANVGPGMSSGLPPGTGTRAPAFETGAGTHQVDPSYGVQHGTMGAAPPGGRSSTQPSKVSRFIGQAEKMAGKLTKNPALVQKGETRNMGGTRAVVGRGPVD